MSKQNFARVILIDDNDTTLFYNSDVVGDYFPEAEVVTFDHPVKFVQSADFLNDQKSTLMLLDLNMPEYSGYDVLEILEEKELDKENLKTIILTSSNLKSDLERSDRFASVISFVNKPITPQKLDSIFNR